MTLPVSSYEELLIQVREITHETVLLQRQLSSDLFDHTDSPDVNHNFSFLQKDYDKGRLLTDNGTKQCKNNEKVEAKHSSLVEHNNLNFRSRFCHSLETTESIRSGTLTNRLLARCCNYRPILSQEDTAAREKKLEKVLAEESRVPRRFSRVGVEDVDSWRVQGRPHRFETATSLSNITAHEREPSSAGAAAAFNPVLTAVATSTARTTTAVRCTTVKNNVDVTDRRPWLHLGRVSVLTETSKEDAMEPEAKEEDERRSSTPSPEPYVRGNRRYNEDGSSEEERLESSLQNHRLPSSYRGTWPIRRDLWANQHMNFSQPSTSTAAQNDVSSVMSFSTNSGVMLRSSVETQGRRRLGAKVDVVYRLLAMLGSPEGREDMSTTLLSMSNSIDSCLVMRQSGCLPLLVQLIHAPGQDPNTRERASQALHNVVHAKSDERAGRREARVLRFLEQLRDYCQALRISLENGHIPEDLERHPGPTIAALMKLSFDEAHRHAMCQLGGLHAVAELIEMDHLAHGSECDDQNCITLRRYAGMALTNLTFGDGNNKALLCSFRAFMRALVSQLRSPSDDLRQVTASVLRNLSWRADSSSKRTLREVGVVTGLMRAAMEGRKESTLKSILSALWNLSAHCTINKMDICAVEGALAFIVDMLSYRAPSRTLAIVENAGGILRNISSHVAVRDDYRSIIRERGCLQVLLQQLRSPSLTVVSNACGALWNLSARCQQDKRLLWDLGAVPMLRSLVNSRHKMISMGSSAALKNLLSERPDYSNVIHLDTTARELGLPSLPTLYARKQRALEQEIDQNLAETCDNIEPSTSPTNKDHRFTFKLDHSFFDINLRALRSYTTHDQPSTSGLKYNNGVARSESRDSMRSVTSTHSDTIFERVNRHMVNGTSPTDVQIKQQSSSLHGAVGFETARDSLAKPTSSQKKYTLRYKNAMSERLKLSDAFTNTNDLKCTNSTISWSSGADQDSACSQTLLHSSMEENLSLMNQSISSTSKTGSQSSISETTETTVSRQKQTVKSAIGTSKVLASYAKEKSPTKKSVTYNNKYVEKSLLHQHAPLNSIQKVISPINHNHNTNDNLFSDYAETDLDQPTDYSLRYAERTSEDDEKQDSAYFANTEQELIHEDTVKTYYTEGTPLETSLNSSRATSASDLQEDSRIKNTTKRLLKQSNVITNKIQNYHQTQFMETEKLNDCEEPEGNLKLQRITQVPERKKMTPSYPVSDTKVMESEQTENNKKNQLSIKKKSDTNTKTIQEIISNFQCTGDSNINPNVVSTIADTPAKFESEGTFVEHDYKLSKILPKNVEVYTENIISKGSNDSGYQISDGDEDDEDLLAACINIGMQNNRHRHSFIGNSFEKLSRTESNLTRYQTSVALDQMESSEIADSTVTSCNIKETESNGEISTASPEATKSSSVNVRKETRRKECVDSHLNSKPDIEIEDEIVLQFSREYAMDEIKDIDEVKNYSYCDLPSNISFDNLEDRIATSGECMAQQCVSIDAEWEDDIVIDDKISDNLTAEDQPYTKVIDSESSESIDSVERSEHALLELCIQPTLSKNDEGILHDKRRQDCNKSSIEPSKKETDFIEQKLITNEKILDTNSTSSDQMSNNFVTKAKNSIEKYAEEEVYRRQRDPDAMIASLDRLTATLVQQTEAMRERNDSTAMKQSTISDTWTEDSPNEVSFPSISISAPLIASFKSDIQEEDQPSELAAEIDSNDQMNMTNSKIIQQEAIKLAQAVDAEANKQNELEITSITSIDLDAIKPPSSMGSLISLTASYAGPTDSNEAFINRDRCYSTSLPPVQTKNVWVTDSRNYHKKSLPLGVVAKRALNQGQSNTGSLENLLNECTNSHLENVKPPSMMDELPDMGDMENSMLSVASITSEIADSKEHDSHSLTGSDPVFDLLKPVANVLSITCMRYAEAMQVSANNSLSECLENINPPSLFNEVSEMDESTMEPTTDTLCSDTLCIDAELKTEEAPHPITIDKIDEAGNDTDEATTPISSEYCVSSSAESTPKKKLNRNYLTPKQKRTLAKERYKTYTIAAEMVRKEEEERGKQESASEEIHKNSRGKCSPFSKLTPKQRRQEDRARFQTQVLENPFPDLIADQTSKNEVVPSTVQENAEKSDIVSPTKSGIPTFTKLFACRGSRKKRLENQETKERYRTRTLNDSESILKDIECNHVPDIATTEEKQERMHDIGPEEIQTILEQNATIVLNTLNESSKATDSTGEDLLLDCETLSLISNESESEKNIKMRFVNGFSKKLLNTCIIKTNNAEMAVQALEEQKETSDNNEIVKPYEELGTDAAESGNENECTEEHVEETKRPRIIKPGTISRDLSADSNMTDKSEPESPKAIRGRRKALYSNPITRKSTPQSSPLKQVNPISGIPIGRSNTSPIVRATRATTLRQNNNSPNFVSKDSPKSNASSKTSSSIDNERKIKNIAVTSKRASVPQKASPSVFNKSTKRHSTPPTCSSNYQNESKSEPLIKPLERQGTFTKDEPEVENAPTVLSSTSPIRTKIAKPLKSTMSKVHPVGGKSKISVRTHQMYQSKITKTNSTEKIQPPKALPLLIAPKRLPSGKLTGPGKVSSNNQNILQSDSCKTFRKVGPLGQRSNSNSSILSNSSTGTQNRKSAKEATSKIAGLWKKVEEKKSKQHLEKSETKPWITSGGGSNEIDAAGSLDQPPAFKLFRSSTFEGVSQDNSHNQRLYKSKFKRPPVAGGIYVNAMKYRNSCDLSGVSGNDITSKASSTKPAESAKKETVQTEDNSVVLRKQQSSEVPAGTEVDSAKRISRLGSFIRVDSTNSESSQTHVSANGARMPMVSAIVPPFNYNPKQDIPLQANKIRLDNAEEKFESTDYHTKMIITSTKVTTV